jgi:hypothetical protein
MQLQFNITGFRQEDREPLALTWERVKESLRNCPNHGMEQWLILHLFYNALNHVSKSMLNTAARGIFMHQSDLIRLTQSIRFCLMGLILQIKLVRGCCAVRLRKLIFALL